MSHDLISVQNGADGFSCVYLTAAFCAAEIARTLLNLAQIRIHPSASLDDAKARLQAAKSRILLTDVWFGTGGWEDALRMAARLPLRTVVVVVSHLADRRLWLDALDRGAYDLLLKPFEADEMRRILENAHFRAVSPEGFAEYSLHGKPEQKAMYAR
jgi:DNA-binding NtrC family response regulator